MEASSFTGSFASSFAAGAKGFVGPIPCAGRIGDFVWHDVNRDGIQDPGEPGINGVTVTLNGTDSFGNPVTLSTTTGPGPMGQQGYYQFTRLCGGTYTATADTPSGYAPTLSLVGLDTGLDSNGSPTPVVLSGLSDQTIDFGFVTECTGRIGDFVWHDVNRNGIQEPGEAGIGNVDVTLLDPTDDSVIASTTTDANGFYTFGGLCAGDYKVKVDESDLPLNFVASPTLQGGDPALDSNPNPFVVTLPAENTVNLTIDFGYNAPCAGSLGDFVWYDKNQNGLQDVGEAGIANVTVNLKDGMGNVLQTTATGANGIYGFSGLCAGTYTVEVDESTIPTGFSPTLVEVGGGTNADSDSNPNPYTIVFPDDFTTDLRIDFGYVAPCSGQIGDFVWRDLNNDGIQDAGEPGISGVTVNLRAAADNALLQTDTTDANGNYLFNGVCPGNYRVEVVPPTGATASPTLQGGNDAVDSNPNPSPVTLLLDDSVDLTHDFGFFFPLASLGDFVWEDLDRDGLQDVGEPGIPGVSVELLKCDGTTLLASTTTNAGGLYLFTNLDEGCYQVRFGLPAGYSRTPLDAGNDSIDSDANVATGVTGSYNLAWGETNLTVDSGLYRLATLGDYVWIDTDMDGVQDTGETQGVVGAIATLQVCAGGVPTGAAPGVVPQVIGSSGAYLFTNLVPGSYAVQFTIPTGFTISPQNAGGDDTKDSDANTATGMSPCVTLLSGQTNLTVDAGAFQPPQVCIPADYSFTGSTSTSGYHGNIRTFHFTGFSAKVSAWSRSKSSNAWATAYLGAYGSGLGVTDRYEGTGANDTHTTDNIDYNNYVLFEFSEQVVVTRAFLDYVGIDSDIQVWVGTFTDPYNNHLALNDTVLGLFGLTDFSDTTMNHGDPRFALFNGGEVPGNALIIAPRPSGTNDSFKLKKLTICVPNSPTAALGDYVWHDFDKDGIQDVTEQGINGATVKLLDAANNVIATRVTGDNPGVSGAQKGYYEFAGLTPGVVYKVQFMMPVGMDTASPRKLGGDAAVDSDGPTSDPVILANGEFNRTIDAGFYDATPVCVAETLVFTGSSSTSGGMGNIRTYTFGSLSVKVSAFSKDKANGAFTTAFLGAYGSGLGVTDSSEGSGANDTHTVDNIGRQNYVLFEFSKPVQVDKVYLDYVPYDSDINVWFAQNPNGNNPYTNHLSLNQALLNAFTVKETNMTNPAQLSGARTANINGGGASGNALVISALTSEADDRFKLKKVILCK
jgi:hypothetical protein